MWTTQPEEQKFVFGPPANQQRQSARGGDGHLDRLNDSHQDHPAPGSRHGERPEQAELGWPERALILV